MKKIVLLLVIMLTLAVPLLAVGSQPVTGGERETALVISPNQALFAPIITDLERISINVNRMAVTLTLLGIIQTIGLALYLSYLFRPPLQIIGVQAERLSNETIEAKPKATASKSGKARDGVKRKKPTPAPTAAE